MSDAEHRHLLALCLARDGDIDLYLVARFGRDPGPVKFPTLDHLNGDKTDHRPENLIRIERSSNSAEGNHARAGGRGRFTTPTNIEGVREAAKALLAQRTPVTPGSRVGEGEKGRERETVNRQGWAITEPSASFNMVWRLQEYLFEQVRDNGHITITDAVSGGMGRLIAREGRGSKSFVENYLPAFAGPEGWLVERTVTGVGKALMFRPGLDRESLWKEIQSRIMEIGGREAA